MDIGSQVAPTQKTEFSSKKHSSRQVNNKSQLPQLSAGDPFCCRFNRLFSTFIQRLSLKFSRSTIRLGCRFCRLIFLDTTIISPDCSSIFQRGNPTGGALSIRLHLRTPLDALRRSSHPPTRIARGTLPRA